MLALSLIIVGILLRFVPHAPNFTPVAAIALFSGAYLNKRYAFIVPLVLMITSDLFIGLHNVVIFTWGAFALITILGLWLKKHRSVLGITAKSLVSAIIFYLVSNFGVWLMGWYPKTPKGLIDCYVMGLPFIRNFTVATLFYALAFFGLYESVAYFVKDKKLAKALLTN